MNLSDLKYYYDMEKITDKSIAPLDTIIKTPDRFKTQKRYITQPEYKVEAGSDLKSLSKDDLYIVEEYKGQDLSSQIFYWNGMTEGEKLALNFWKNYGYKNWVEKLFNKNDTTLKSMLNDNNNNYKYYWLKLD